MRNQFKKKEEFEFTFTNKQQQKLKPPIGTKSNLIT